MLPPAEAGAPTSVLSSACSVLRPALRGSQLSRRYIVHHALATVVEIFKGKGSHSDPEMYRHISLLNTAYKIFARSIQARMAKAMGHKLRDTQWGFRANRSCIQPLYILHRLQEMALEKTSAFYMLFLDWEMISTRFLTEVYTTHS